MSEIEVPDCPLCMETFEIDDINFFPCTCGYQVCRFCWHRIRTDENGLCPACRKTYSENPAMYQPLSQDELQKIKKERKQKDVQQRQKASDSRQHLSNIRVIQKHLVFVVGLSNKMADPEVLRKQEYFGKYGKILKIVINPNTNYAGPQGPSASAYITYSREEEALRTILSINNMQPPLKIRASLGTTKYCSHYLRNTICPKQDCMYLHDLGDMHASFTKEDMQAGKHQIFEKDLIDNMLSMQKQHSNNQNHNSTSSNNDISEDTSESGWGDVDSDSLLPSNVSWAAIRDERERKATVGGKSRTNSTSSTDYPTIEGSSVKSSSPPTTSTSAIDIKINKLQEESLKKANSCSPKDSSSYPKGGWMTKADTTSKKKDEPIVVNEPTVIQPAPEATPQQPKSQPSTSIPPPITTEAAVTTTRTTTVTTSSNNYPWPTVIDLGLSDLQIVASDDELGFDPFKESKTGLEDLIAKEEKQGVTTIETTPKPTFSWDSFWPSNYGNTTPMMMGGGHSYSLFNSVQSLPQQQQMRPTAPVNPYQMQNTTNSNNSVPPSNPPLQNPSTSYPFRFSNPQASQSVPASMTSSNFMRQQQSGVTNPPPPLQSYGSRFPFMQPTMNPLQQQQPGISLSTTTTTTTTTSTTVSSSESKPDKNWQDGLRALLPNINISFNSNWNNEKKEWNENDPMDLLQRLTQEATTTLAQQQNEQQQQHASVQPTNQHHESSVASSVASPPPGFSLLSSFESKNKSTWPEKDDQQHQRVRAPPPGFNTPASCSSSVASASECFNNNTSAINTVASNAAPTNGILSSVATTVTIQSTTSTTTATAATNIPQHPSNNKRHSQILMAGGSQEDPSILWSRVLAEKTNREIETTNMVFPLPGETVDQALIAANVPATPPQSMPHQQNMMSWNSVVSGNQYGKSPTATTSINSRDIMEPCSVNTSSGKDSKDQIRPQKPSPIFGNQQKHAIKKPTAHVKPLKCTPPATDGFMTVHSSSSGSSASARQSNARNTGSRVSELDDFSIDLPPVLAANASNMSMTANVVRSFVEYPPVSQATTTTATGKSKKKKRKGKEQSGLISEVVVSLSTCTTVQQQQDIKFIEEEKQPKKGKNKKKNNKTTSPQSQRKNDDAGDGVIVIGGGGVKSIEHTIRIMKTGDSSDNSSSQAGAGNSNGVQDHEIVSRLTESTEKLLKNVLFETEAIKLNTEQISKDLKSALEKCKESSLSLSDLEKINLLLTPAKLSNADLDDPDLVDTSDLERQVESARREAKLLEARLNDVIRKNMASELETLKRNTKSAQQQQQQQQQ